MEIFPAHMWQEKSWYFQNKELSKISKKNDKRIHADYEDCKLIQVDDT